MQRSAGAATDADFVRVAEPFRRELLAHCYRMLGSVHDAEDLVQETYLRAWRAYGSFEGRSSVRVWLYRIATNACLSALAHHSRRMLPSGLGGPSDDPNSPSTPAGPEVLWVQPIPDALVRPETDDPAAIVASREGLRLALIASLQYLPARQRAVLILRDVMAFSAAEVAEMLEMTVTAVKSSLQRARAKLDEVSPAVDDVVEPDDARVRALLEQYIEAIENPDAAALEKVFVADARLEATPFVTWFAGRATCVPFLITQVLGEPGDWRMFLTRANGQPAAVGYRRRPDRRYEAYGVLLVTCDETGITRVLSFGDPTLVDAYGMPRVLDGHVAS